MILAEKGTYLPTTLQLFLLQNRICKILRVFKYGIDDFVKIYFAKMNLNRGAFYSGIVI